MNKGVLKKNYEHLKKQKPRFVNKTKIEGYTCVLLEIHAVKNTVEQNRPNEISLLKTQFHYIF